VICNLTQMPYEIHDLPSKNIKFGLWFLSHKDQFKKAGILLLLLWCVVTVGYSIYGLTVHFLEIGPLQQSLAGLITDNINLDKLRQSQTPKPLNISDASVVYTGNNRYDLYAEVENPNTNYAIDNLTFTFEGPGLTTEPATVYILPGQKIYLMSLGNVVNQHLTQAAVKISNLKWHRITTLANFPQLDIKLSTININQSPDQLRSWIDFTATNNTVYNFREIKWLAVLYSGQQIVALNELTSNDFITGEARDITLSWFNQLPQISKAEVIPMINLSDSNNFYKIPGQDVQPLPDF